MKIVIASNFVVKSRKQFKRFCAEIEKEIKKHNLKLIGLIWVDAGSCSNLGLDIEGGEHEIEKFADKLTFTLMPARWNKTDLEIPKGYKCELF